jgi:hypothetical protein
MKPIFVIKNVPLFIVRSFLLMRLFPISALDALCAKEAAQWEQLMVIRK